MSTGAPEWTQWVLCDCGKRSYSSKSAAKAAARRLPRRMDIYECRAVPGKIHLTTRRKK